jgi:hypothetical protein
MAMFFFSFFLFSSHVINLALFPKIKGGAPSVYYDFMSNYTYFCDEQEEKLEVIHAVVFLVRNALVFPLGIFLDMYGTTRTRL